MQEEEAKQKLFIVFLGGKASKSHIEQHDVRWVIGSSIENTFFQLREEWFGERVGLHIDSYIELKYIDGYEVILKKVDYETNKKSNSIDRHLWFVNLGGYTKDSLIESHNFGLFIAKNQTEAKRKAKENWKSNFTKKHNDDIHILNTLKKITQNNTKEDLNEWRIELKKDNKNRNQKLYPKWYGYMRID